MLYLTQGLNWWPNKFSIRELDDGREWRTEIGTCFDNKDTCLPGIIPCLGGGIVVEVSRAVSRTGLYNRG